MFAAPESCTLMDWFEPGQVWESDGCQPRGLTCSEHVEAIDVMQEGNISHNQSGGSLQASSKASSSAQHSVNATGPPVGPHSNAHTDIQNSLAWLGTGVVDLCWGVRGASLGI